MHLSHLTYDEIAHQLRTVRPRISGTTSQFHHSGIVPNPLQIGRPRKTKDGITFIETRTLREPSISAFNLSHEIAIQFGVPVSCTAINVIRRVIHKY
jgi:hypothetical protein